MPIKKKVVVRKSYYHLYLTYLELALPRQSIHKGD
jgi:hypothetical protein